jgi:dTDP-4-dehydrorhamnose reductase
LKTILLLGRSGQLGWELVRSLQPLGLLVTPSRREADLSHPASLTALVSEVRPDIIVNSAAYTAVDAAEKEEELAYRVNAESPAALAQAAKDVDAWLVHYSTDYVFDGDGGPYAETARTAPLNAYGRSKEVGERGIRATGCRHLILRTSWVYGVRGQNFLTTILRLARERDVLRIVNDQIGAPTWTRTIADVTATVLSRIEARPDGAALGGTYHVASQGETSWYEFAKLVVEATQTIRDASPRLDPITTEEYPSPARRPRDSRLDSRKVTAAFGVHLPHWRDAALLCLEELKAR